MLPLLLLILATSAAAEDCTVLATQMEMNACAGRNFDAADADLNAAYRAVADRLGDDMAARGRLRDAQRAWIAFRDADCTFAAASVAGGSIYPMIWSGCREAATRSRTETLRSYLACPEGDLACPLSPQ